MLVAGIDSSTQSCKVVVRDARTGALVRSGSAPHPDGTEVDPGAWWDALNLAVDAAGGLDDVRAVSVAGQQHGMVCLDSAGRVIRPALLWNDTRSAPAADDLIANLGEGDPVVGARRWAVAVGTVPVASITVSKLRWLADHEPDNAARVAAVALPHDWLTWRITGSARLDSLMTDRSEASGTGYFDAVGGEYRRDLLALALRRDTADDVVLPRVLGPSQRAGTGAGRFAGLLVGPGCGDNAGAALGLGLTVGQTMVSLGTSGVIACVSATPTADPSGVVAGFADATGHHLPLACTLNGARVFDAVAGLLRIGHDELARLALQAEPGSGGLVLIPYLEGERTPNLPGATGQLHGMTLANLGRANIARAAVEGLCGLLGRAIEGMRSMGVAVDNVTVTGGGARSEAFRRIAASVWAVPVHAPEPSEDVADGAARQAAWVMAGSVEPTPPRPRHTVTFDTAATPQVQRDYDAAALRLESFPGRV
jgi:xylulokinase